MTVTCFVVLGATEGSGEGLISTLTFTLRFALAAVLTVSAVAKLRSFDEFRWTVRAILPWRRTASALAAAVVAVEATLAVLLAAGVLADAVAAATFVLFLGFAVLSLWAELRGLRVRCNCFGHSGRAALLGAPARREPRARSGRATAGRNPRSRGPPGCAVAAGRARARPDDP